MLKYNLQILTPSLDRGANLAMQLRALLGKHSSKVAEAKDLYLPGSNAKQRRVTVGRSCPSVHHSKMECEEYETFVNESE